MNTEETYKLNIPRYLRARLIATNGEITEMSVEAIEQVVRVVDGYLCPPVWQARTLSGDESKGMGIFLKQKVGDVPMTTNDPQRDTQFSGFARMLLAEILSSDEHTYSDLLDTGSDEWQREARDIIARRAYDLMIHTIYHADSSIDPGWAQVPDLTEFSEQSTHSNSDVPTHLVHLLRNKWYAEGSPEPQDLADALDRVCNYPTDCNEKCLAKFLELRGEAVQESRGNPMTTIDTSKRIQRYRTAEEARHALQQFIDCKHTLHVPPQIDDADFVISDVIDELLDLREAIEQTRTDLLVWLGSMSLGIDVKALSRLNEIIDKLEEVAKRSPAKAVKEG